MVREQLAAHLLDTGARLVLARPLQLQLDVLPDAHVGDLAKAERSESLLHRAALWIVDYRLSADDAYRDHLSFLGFGGKTRSPPTPWQSAHYPTPPSMPTPS